MIKRNGYSIEECSSPSLSPACHSYRSFLWLFRRKDSCFLIAESVRVPLYMRKCLATRRVTFIFGDHRENVALLRLEAASACWDTCGRNIRYREIDISKRDDAPVFTSSYEQRRSKTSRMKHRGRCKLAGMGFTFDWSQLDGTFGSRNRFIDATTLYESSSLVSIQSE